MSREVVGVWDLFRCDIQAASDTGFKTGLAAGENPTLLRPVELLRGGIALGDGKLSVIIMYPWIRGFMQPGVDFDARSGRDPLYEMCGASLDCAMYVW